MKISAFSLNFLFSQHLNFLKEIIFHLSPCTIIERHLFESEIVISGKARDALVHCLPFKSYSSACTHIFWPFLLEFIHPLRNLAITFEKHTPSCVMYGPLHMESLQSLQNMVIHTFYLSSLLHLTFRKHFIFQYYLATLIFVICTFCSLCWLYL